jgi:hypothetical protein
MRCNFFSQEAITCTSRCSQVSSLILTVCAELRWRIFEIMLTNAIVSFAQVDARCVSAVNRGRHPIVDPSQHFVTKDE